MMYEKKITTDKFLTPKYNRHNGGFGEDIASYYAEKLIETDKYIVTNVLSQDSGFGFWISIQKEKFWFSIELLSAPKFLWKINIEPVGIAKLTFFFMRKTFRGDRIIKDIEIITKNLAMYKL